MSDNEFDFIIVGQGLAGSVLSMLLLREKKKILVIAKNGEYITQLDLSFLTDIRSFCVDEEEKMLYIAQKNKVYSAQF